MLKKIKPEKYNVLSSFLERKKDFPVYDSIVNTISGNIIYKSTKTSTKNNSNLYCIYDFPNYLNGLIINKNWKVKSINTYKGSLILLKNYTDTQNYLKTKFNTPKRFRIYKNKLETCFNIEYKSYYGNISKEEYDSLFDTFQKMLKKRFLEKKIENHDLARWNTYHEIAYPLINNKEAVLFVIYNDEIPIAFYLNLLKNKTIYGYVKTYDTDYSKFSIGVINFLQQLNWCFDNDIEVYDLLKGNYPYKNKLIDTEFYYQKHIIYNSKSILAVILANIIITRTKVFYAIVNILKKLNIDILFHKISNFIYQNKIEDDPKDIIITNNIKISSTDKLVEIDINNDSSMFLKRTVYTFLYHNKEPLKSVQVFKFENECNSFLIKGKKQSQKIMFK